MFIPCECIKWAHVDADPAVHAQRVVDVKSVKNIDFLGTSRTFFGDLNSVRIKVDAPGWAFAHAQHA